MSVVTVNFYPSFRRNRCSKIYLLAATIPRAALVDMSNERSILAVSLIRVQVNPESVCSCSVQ